MNLRFGVRARKEILAIASCLALFLALSPVGAAAQDATAAVLAETSQNDQSAQDQTGGDIVVTGFRGSLESALNTKKNATAMVDSINAQDIADFPDANLADSLPRIPGISIERDGGEGRTITVRGLSGDFSRTRFNGLESIVATADFTLGAGLTANSSSAHASSFNPVS